MRAAGRARDRSLRRGQPRWRRRGTGSRSFPHSGQKRASSASKPHSGQNMHSSDGAIGAAILGHRHEENVKAGSIRRLPPALRRCRVCSGCNGHRRPTRSRPDPRGAHRGDADGRLDDRGARSRTRCRHRPPARWRSSRSASTAASRSSPPWWCCASSCSTPTGRPRRSSTRVSGRHRRLVGWALYGLIVYIVASSSASLDHADRAGELAAGHDARARRPARDDAALALEAPTGRGAREPVAARRRRLFAGLHLHGGDPAGWASAQQPVRLVVGRLAGRPRDDLVDQGRSARGARGGADRGAATRPT